MTFEDAVWIGLGIRVGDTPMPPREFPRTHAERVTDWHRHCINDCPFQACICIDVCECGHFRSQHGFDYAPDSGPSYEGCEVQTHENGTTCACARFTHDDQDQ